MMYQALVYLAVFHTSVLCADLWKAQHLSGRNCDGSDCCHTVSYGIRLYRYNAADTYQGV